MLTYKESLDKNARIIIAYINHTELGLGSIMARSSTLSIIYKIPRNKIEQDLTEIVKVLYNE